MVESTAVAQARRVCPAAQLLTTALAMTAAGDLAPTEGSLAHRPKMSQAARVSRAGHCWPVLGQGSAAHWLGEPVGAAGPLGPWSPPL